jgi:hypothetical protein
MALTFTSMDSMSSTGHVEIASEPPLTKPLSKKGIHPMRPKSDKAPNPYFLFCQKRRTELQAENPLMPSREVTRLLASEWRNLPTVEKDGFAQHYQSLLSQKETERKAMAPSQDKQFLIQIPLPNGQFLVVPAYFA